MHGAVQAAFNAGDVDALVDLYEPDARMGGAEGDVVVGIDAIREVWASFVALGGTLTLETQFVIEHGDVALLGNHWTFHGADDLSFGAATAEIVHRQADGTWRYVVDHPFAGVLPA